MFVVDLGFRAELASKCCFVLVVYVWKWLIVNRRKRSPSRSAFPIHLQVNSLQQVIKLTKENLDKIEGQFLNVQHPPSIFLEVGDDFSLACLQKMIGKLPKRRKQEACSKCFKLWQRF